jgi:hypothetical protein
MKKQLFTFLIIGLFSLQFVFAQDDPFAEKKKSG